MREAEHLREVRHRALAAVVLPVGVGDEADRGIEADRSGATADCPAGLNGSEAWKRIRP